MSKFIHTPDDTIIIDDFSCTLAFFLIQEPAYALPSGKTSQYYEQSVKHFVSDGINGGLLSLPYTAGDGYISNKATYVTALEDYIYYPDLTTAKETKISEAVAYANQYYNGNVVFSGNTYFSQDGVSSDAHQYYVRYSRSGTIPLDFYLRDITGSEHVLTLADLSDIADLIDDLHRATDENIHDHIDAINALTTIQDVKDYVFTTGWPTIPYSP